MPRLPHATPTANKPWLAQHRPRLNDSGMHHPSPPRALVTGARTGLGRAFAEALRREGYAVTGTSRSAAADPPFPLLSADFSTRAGIAAFIAAHGDLLASLDLLVNNAGAGVFGAWDSMPETALAEQLDLLLLAPLELARRTVPAMRARGGGTVVMVSSLAADLPLPGMPLYCAAKAGLAQAVRSLRLLEDDRRIRWIDFQPGDYRTDFNRQTQIDPDLAGATRTAWQAMERHMARAPDPERAARDLLRALRRGRGGVVRSGSWFQARLAPFGRRLLPETVLRRLIRAYYGLRD
jgi:NAD(P)-dependent dehydrogenase (short-subunit alcohol dehydrogenase family)